MDTTKTCQHCGKPIGPKGVGGMCPECLMKVGLGSGVGSNPGSGGAAKSKNPGSPSLAEVARHFPQLEIIEQLGEGGMGAVYKARQAALDRVVALKILPLEAAADPGFQERFIREARALAKLIHPNIVAVHEFGQADGFHYFIMEFVDGPNLRQLEQAEKLSARDALKIIPQICEALQYAHDEGVVHRDIKPENVLLDKRGRVKIADFGLAKILGREPETLRLTGAKDFMGTPHYVAPEQVERPQTVDHRADIYSLGVVFYEMLTGELPLGRFQPPSRKVEVDVRLDEVVLHALEKEPERRYQHASEVKTDVENIVMSSPAATPAPVVAPTALNPWQPPILLLGVLISLALLLAATVLPRPANWMALLFGSVAFIVGAVKFAGLWPFPSPVFPGSNFTRRNLPSGRANLAGADSRAPLRSAIAVGLTMFLLMFLAAIGVTVFLPKADVERNLGIGLLLGVVNGLMTGILTYVGMSAARSRPPPGGVPGAAGDEGARSQVKGPAVGLLVTGILNWILLPLAALLIVWVVPREWAGGPLHLSNTAVSVACLASLILCSFIIYAALKMMRLEARWAALTAGVLAMLVSPGNVVGLPIGVWALVVLNRREVRQAFAKHDSPDAQNRRRGLVLLGLATCLLMIILTVSLAWREKWQSSWLASSAPEKVAGTAPTLGEPLPTNSLPESEPGQPALITPADPAAALARAPSVVIQTVPQSGSTDVDPALGELRVTFSKSMQDSSWSWVQIDPETFPEVTGPARYLDDKRTCVLPVKLKPGKLYATWLNDYEFTNFRDTTGEPAVPYLLIFETRPQLRLTTSPTADQTTKNNNEDQE